MTDVNFMTISEHINSKFALVHFDGPHMTTDVIAEAVWFAQRSAPVTRFIFDDYPKYNLTSIEDVLKWWGFRTIERGSNKALLEKNN